MGRSVSRHKYSLEVCYEDISNHGYAPEFDDNGDEIHGDDPDKWVYDEFCHQVDWDCWVEYQQDKAKKLFPSMTECDEWLDREDRAIMENDFAYIGVSEYCGLASIWLVFKGDVMDIDNYGLGKAWCGKACHGFSQTFGDLVKLGKMSNGEGVYRKASA